MGHLKLLLAVLAIGVALVEGQFQVGVGRADVTGPSAEVHFVSLLTWSSAYGLLIKTSNITDGLRSNQPTRCRNSYASILSCLHRSRCTGTTNCLRKCWRTSNFRLNETRCKVQPLNWFYIFLTEISFKVVLGLQQRFGAIYNINNVMLSASRKSSYLKWFMTVIFKALLWPRYSRWAWWLSSVRALWCLVLRVHCLKLWRNC